MNSYIKYKIFVFSVFLLLSVKLYSQDIPQHITSSGVYELIDELANEGIIEINSAVKPYSRNLIAEKLLEATSNSKNLSKRQISEIRYYLNDYSSEMGDLPDSKIKLYRNNNADISLIQPAFHYSDSIFRARILPILGMHITSNKNGNIVKRWYGASFESLIGKNLSIYGSVRDVSIEGALLARPSYLNNFSGYEYKESTKGGDFSDSRGGIKFANKWLSVGLIKDNIVWGDNNHGSNIISGRVPSFPMITLMVKPAKWFELNYFHGWLVSNVLDSTRFYVENTGAKMYRQTNKFIAANLFTFTPIPKFNISFGNSIIYAENNIQPAYFLPVAFYKSIDHTLTKGLKIENQNSQLFLNVSSRIIKHLHLYTSIFFDEIEFSRFKPSSAEKNPGSFKFGAQLSNFPLKNLSAVAEFTRTGIITYKHSIPALTWASNGYNLGHYLSDNSHEIYAAIKYKPLKGLSVDFSFTDAKHGNEYIYLRRNSLKMDQTKIFLSQPSLGEISWSNRSYELNIRYEVFNNAFAIINLLNSNIQGYDLTSTPIQYDESEVLRDAQGYLNIFSPAYLHGKNTTITFGFSFGF